MDQMFRHRSEAEATREKRDLSGGQILPGKEIVIIAITIIMNIIEIIITIFLNTSTISISIPSHLTVTICVVLCTIHPLYFTDVDYYFLVDAIKFFWRIIVMIRLFTIYSSPLIMISFMSFD